MSFPFPPRASRQAEQGHFVRAFAMTSTCPRTPPAGRRRAAWVAAALLVAATAWWGINLSAGDKGGPKKKIMVPADLAWIPSDAAFFLQLRPTDIWDCEPGKVLREQLPEDVKRLHRDMEQDLGVGPADMESLTLVFPTLRDFGGSRGDGLGRKVEVFPPKD